MTKEEAQRLAQEKVAAARELLLEAGALMDEHRFSVELSLGSCAYRAVSYLPKDLTKVEAGTSYDGEGLFWCGVDDWHRRETEDGGYWVPSSESGEC